MCAPRTDQQLQAGLKREKWIAADLLIGLTERAQFQAQAAKRRARRDAGKAAAATTSTSPPPTSIPTTSTSTLPSTGFPRRR